MGIERRLAALEAKKAPQKGPDVIWWLSPTTEADLSAGFQVAVRNWFEEGLGWRSEQVRVDSRIYSERGEIVEIFD
jgi:hypothetical protein